MKAKFISRRTYHFPITYFANRFGYYSIVISNLYGLTLANQESSFLITFFRIAIRKMNESKILQKPKTLKKLLPFNLMIQDYNVKNSLENKKYNEYQTSRLIANWDVKGN